MKGLLLKDYYLLMKNGNGKLLLLLILGFMFFAAFNQEITFFVYYPIVLVGTLTMLLIQVDESDKWEIYSHTLPYSKEQLVTVKYLVGLIAFAIIFILSAILQFLAMNKQGIYTTENYKNLLVSLFIMGLLTPAILNPFIFKLGAQKGRLVYYLVLGASMALSTQLTYKTSVISTDTSVAIPLAFVVIIVAIYIFSWRLSISFYKKREL